MILNDSQQFFSQLLPYGPNRNIDDLVVEVNRLFHAIDADDYDCEHPEIHIQLPGIWKGLFSKIIPKADQRWRILDFGSGTGFATEMALANLNNDQIESVTCYDLSEKMLFRAKNRLLSKFNRIKFTTAFPSDLLHFNLLLSNSVLHHLPNVNDCLKTLERILTPDATWILGHEPSSRFFSNITCAKHYNSFMQHYKWHKFIQPKNYISKIKSLLLGNAYSKTAKQSVRNGLFCSPPTDEIISRLVDFGVAHNTQEALGGRGLDFRKLEIMFADRWKLLQVETYSYMGDRYEGFLNNTWLTRCKVLAKEFPDDGANFSCIWKRL